MDEARQRRLFELFGQIGAILAEGIGEAMASGEIQHLRNRAEKECGCLTPGCAIEADFSSRSLKFVFFFRELNGGKDLTRPAADAPRPAISVTNEDRALAHEMHIRLDDDDKKEIESASPENVSADSRGVEEIIQSIRKFALRLEPTARRIISDFLNQEKVNKAFGVPFPKDETIENDEIFLGSVQEIINRIQESARGAENIKNMLISFENVVLAGFRQE